MRVVGFDEFAEMPPGTIFCFVDEAYSPPYRGFYRKEATITHDWGDRRTPRPADFFMTPLTPCPQDGWDSPFVK